MDPPPYGFKYIAEPMSYRAAQKRVEDNKRRRQEQKKQRRFKSKESMASINEEDEMDERILLQREKRKNEKLTSELQELKIKHEGTIQHYERTQNTQSEKFKRKQFEFLKKIEQLEKEIQELRKNQGSSSNSQTQELHHKVNQQSTSLKAKEQQILKLKELLERSENSEKENSTEIQILNALLSQKKYDLNRKDKEISKLIKRLKQKNEQQNQQKPNDSAQVVKLQQQLEHAQKFCSINESKMQELKENFQQKEKLIVQKDKEILELSELLKNQSNPHSLSKQPKHQKKDEEKTGWLNVIGGILGLQNQKMLVDSKIVKSVQQQSILIGMFAKNKRPKGFKLLFRASDNQFKTKIYKGKQKYCYVEHTVLLVKTEYGKVIGGYTPLQWKLVQLVDSKSYSQHDTSGESFIFSISNNHKLTLESPTKNQAVHHCNIIGPCFQTGIIISNHSNTYNKSSSLYYDKLGYVHPEYKAKDKDSWIKFVGSSDGKFYTKQWEVHRVIFEEES